MKQVQAFSLIELMIVIAIVGILATVGIPSYQNYMIRARISEAVTIASHINKLAVEYYTTTGGWPNNLAAMNLTANSFNTDYITGLTFAVTANTPIFGLTLNAATVGNSGVTAGTAGTVFFGSKQLSGSEIISTACGQYNATSTLNVAIKYLPTGCNDKAVFGFVNTP